MGGKLEKVKCEELLYLLVNSVSSASLFFGPNSRRRSEAILLDGCKPQGNPLLRQ